MCSQSSLWNTDGLSQHHGFPSAPPEDLQVDMRWWEQLQLPCERCMLNPYGSVYFICHRVGLYPHLLHTDMYRLEVVPVVESRVWMSDGCDSGANWRQVCECVSTLEYTQYIRLSCSLAHLQLREPSWGSVWLPPAELPVTALSGRPSIRRLNVCIWGIGSRLPAVELTECLVTFPLPPW